MGRILSKSHFNIDAAELLINNNIYAPSVHCSYYGCFQFARYTLKNYKNISYAELDLACNVKSYGSHNALKNYLLPIIKSKFLISDEYNRFKRLYNDLKELRENSDYHDIEINMADSEKSLKYSKELISEIKKQLKWTAKNS